MAWVVEFRENIPSKSKILIVVATFYILDLYHVYADNYFLTL